MKKISTFTLTAFAVTLIGNGTALADSSQLHEWIAVQRQEMQRRQKATTIAVYAGRHGVNQQSTMQQDKRPAVRTNWQGQAFGGQGPGPVAVP